MKPAFFNSLLFSLMLFAPIVSAQGTSGCLPAALAALELKSIADENGQEVALGAWHRMRVMQDLPVWHATPLTNLMEMPLADMNESEVRAAVLVACTLTLSEFASNTARERKEQPQSPPETDRR